MYRRAAIKCFNEGDFQEAIRWHKLHLKATKDIADRAEEGLACGSLGITFFHLGDLKEAINYHSRHLSICKELGDQAGEGRAYSNLGSVFDSLNDFIKAKVYHQLHLDITKELGDKEGEKSACANLGKVYVHLRDYNKAIEYHRLHLIIAKELGDRAGEVNAYANLAFAYASLRNFRRSIQYHNLHLSIVQEIGDKVKEEVAYSNLGMAYRNLGDFRTAVGYHQQQLEIAKDRRDRHSEADAYASLGHCFRSLGDYRTAVKYDDLHLSAAKEIGDRKIEGRAYASLSTSYCFLRDFERAVYCSQLHLIITQEIGDRTSEGQAYGNLGDAYHFLGNFETAAQCHQLALSISKELQDKAAEGHAYQSLGRDFCRQGNFKKGLEYHSLHLSTAKMTGDQADEGIAYNHLGNTYYFLGDLSRAEESYKLSAKLFDGIKNNLQLKEHWQISLRNYQKDNYNALWKVLLKQGNVSEALLTAERERKQALEDLIEWEYGFTSNQTVFCEANENEFLNASSPQIVFIAVDQNAINLWVLDKGNSPYYEHKEIDQRYLKDCVDASLASLSQDDYRRTGVEESGSYEDRSLDVLLNVETRDKSNMKRPAPFSGTEDPLRVLHDMVISPVANKIQSDEIIVVPDGPLLYAPFAALLDRHFKFFSEMTTVRIIPTLSSLKFMEQCSEGRNRKDVALLVGDPWLGSIRVEKKGEKKEKKKKKRKGNKKVEVSGLSQLPAAKTEMELIGMILNIKPLTGRDATKQEVLRQIRSATLVHIATRGKVETGEIVLSPNTRHFSETLKEEDYLLTIRDLKDAELQAKLVVLSCYHSGRGEVKSEGVVNIARAFLGAGAQSVLVSLWGICNEATQEFMRNFYNNLVDGLSTSKCLSLAMKIMRQSDRFSDAKYWAPFVLIGDDVTFNFYREPGEDRSLKKGR